MNEKKPPSLKRLAWAFGCAKKGSTDEASLRDQLVARLKEQSVDRAAA